MDSINLESTGSSQQAIHWGHFGTILAAIVLLLGLAWMKQPQLFSFKKTSYVAADHNIPQYYAYVAPPEDQPKPAVAGATTNPGPMVINEDGTVSPVDMGQVLGASTQD